jgi:hypothetical protein
MGHSRFLMILLVSSILFLSFGYGKYNVFYGFKLPLRLRCNYGDGKFFYIGIIIAIVNYLLSSFLIIFKGLVFRFIEWPVYIAYNICEWLFLIIKEKEYVKPCVAGSYILFWFVSFCSIFCFSFVVVGLMFYFVL